MKRKLTILMFSLLLAVGWANVASAQSYVLKASDMNTDGEWWTYKWKNAAGDSIESPYVVLNPETNKYEAPQVTDPYQIYGLLRKVYMDTRLPGPTYSAYDASGNREDPVFYGGMGGGWNIGATYGALGNITIKVTQSYSSSYPVYIKSIKIMDGSTEVTKLEYEDGMTAIPDGWTSTAQLSVNSNNEMYYSTTSGGTLTVNASLLQGHPNVNVVVNARNGYGSYDYSYWAISVNNSSKNINTGSLSDYTWSISAPASYLPDGTFTPKNEGYTALIVSLVNDTTKIHDESNDPHDGAWEFKTDAEVINYIKDNFQYVKLLTDGLRIGQGDSVGTVFNCSGTYNRFFFLGKGQARKKAPRMQDRINNASTWGIDGEIYCEEGPFKYMYEEFSPTSGLAGSDITDFYMEMMDGAVYPVVHDCASVIQNKHQFSMSGKKGTQAYAMSGMNFFIPDYRLKFWTDQHTYSSDYVSYNRTRTVDGRDMNAYEEVDANGNRTELFGNYTNAVYSHWSVYWAQYNPDYAPLVGLYTLSLDANAEPCEGYLNPGNTNYVVTLDWTSSLNEMSNKNVPQMYIIYEVMTDSVGAEYLEVVDTVYNETTYDFGGKLWPQTEHSQTHNYIIMGSPTDNDHPSFVAWSNEDDIIIPGLNDFLMLNLDHYESDFDVPNVQNWYRNFLTVNNDSYKGLTTRGIFEGDSVFNLLRYANLDSTITEQVARIKFANQSNGTVKYTINYVDANGANSQNIEDYDIHKDAVWNDNHTQIIKPEVNIPDAYELSTMGIPTEGYLNIKTDRDIIIKPNGYGISFNQITLIVNDQTKGTWRASNGTSWPTGWSAQGKWTKDDGDDYYYMDGNGTGYILISGTAVGADATNVQVVINAFGDPGKTAKIDVNGTSKALLNGEENLRDYTWDVQFNRSYHKAPNRAETTGSVTVCDGTQTNSYLPVYGYYYDYRQFNQILYTADQLGNLPAGTKITSLTFYPTTTSFFNGSTLTVKLGTTTQSSYSEFADIVPNDLAQVASLNVTNGNYSVNGWTINFSTPFVYNGNNLLIQIESEAGNDVQTAFYGKNTTNSMGFYSYWSVAYSQWRGALQSFQPKATFTYTTEGGGGDDPIIDPTVEGLVRIANLPIVDQFAKQIPAANNHPYRYSYFLKLADADSTSNTVRVPVQHTGAKMQGYYTIDEMKGDSVPENFLTENVISAQIDMNLSPTSAPYYYTINSKKGGDPADAWSNYLSVLQRREAGDYEERQSRSGGVDNPYNGHQYDPGEFNMLDYRKLTSANTDTFASYVPIIWTNGIKRHYYTTDSLHNSYGAPIWRVKRGDVEFNGYVQRQMKTLNGGWNPSVNWWVKNEAGTDSTAYGLYFVEFDARGFLPVNPGIEYEPYMFRVWLVDSTESLRNYTWETNAQGKPIKIVDGGARPGKWFLLAEKQCNGDLRFQRTITEDYANNVQFAGPLFNFKPRLVARFYYKVKDQDAPAPSGMRGLNDDNNVGYVVLKGVHNDPETAVHEVVIVGEIVDQIFYNAQGMQSNRPFEGINIVVTRYSDGTTSTSKVRY